MADIWDTVAAQMQQEALSQQDKPPDIWDQVAADMPEGQPQQRIQEVSLRGPAPIVTDFPQEGQPQQPLPEVSLPPIQREPTAFPPIQMPAPEPEMLPPGRVPSEPPIEAAPYQPNYDFMADMPGVTEPQGPPIVQPPYEAPPIHGEPWAPRPGVETGPAGAPTFAAMADVPRMAMIRGVEGVKELHDAIAESSLSGLPPAVTGPLEVGMTSLAGGPTASEAIKFVRQAPELADVRNLPAMAKREFAGSPFLQNSIEADVGHAAGSFAPIALAEATTGGAATVPFIMAQTLGHTLEAKYNENIARGMNPDNAARNAYAVGLAGMAASGATWKFLPQPVKNVTDKFIVDKMGRVPGMRFLSGRIAQGVEGGVLGIASQVSQNVATGRPTLEGVPESAKGLGLAFALSPRGYSAKEVAARRISIPPGEARQAVSGAVQLPGGERRAGGTVRGPELKKAKERAKETSKRASEDIAISNYNRLLADTRTDPKGTLVTNARRFRDNVPKSRQATNNRQQVRNAIAFFKGNLVKAARAALKEPWARMAAKQYEGYNIYSHELADRYGYKPEDVMVAESAQSPNASPDNSFEATRRLMKMLREDSDHVFDAEMENWARNKVGKNKKGETVHLYTPAEVDYLVGKKFSELPKGEGAKQAHWMRAYDEIHHPDRLLRVVRPDGTLGATVKTSTGLDQPFAWTSFSPMQNAINALQGNRSPDVILSTPKVANYYMSKLLAFEHSNHVVADTHHTSASWGNSLPSSHPLVKDVFSSDRSMKDGTFSGYYSIVHEATLQAAKELRMNPKELQAMVWSYQRGLKAPDPLGPTVAEAIQNLWKGANEGNITERQAYDGTEHIAREFHGGIVPAPDYFGAKPGSAGAPPPGTSGKPAELPSRSGVPGSALRGGGIPGAEGAPVESAAGRLSERAARLQPKSEAGSVGGSGGEERPEERERGPVITGLPARPDQTVVHIPVEKFDPKWAQERGSYLEPGGTGENYIGERYKSAQDLVASGKPIKAPDVSVWEDGTIRFTDGRHRYAAMRDAGVKDIPISLDAESLANARKSGLIPGEKPERGPFRGGAIQRDPEVVRAGMGLDVDATARELAEKTANSIAEKLSEAAAKKQAGYNRSYVRTGLADDLVPLVKDYLNDALKDPSLWSDWEGEFMRSVVGPALGGDKVFGSPRYAGFGPRSVTMRFKSDQRTPEFGEYMHGLYRRYTDWRRSYDETTKTQPDTVSTLPPGETGSLAERARRLQPGSESGAVGASGGEVGELPEEQKARAFGVRLQDDQRLLQELKDNLGNKDYTPIPNNLTASQAVALVEGRRVSDVINGIKDESNGLQFHIRSTMGQLVIQKLNDGAATLKAVGDLQGSKQLLDQAIEMSEWAMEYGTRLGQGVQSFAMWNRLTPEGKLQSVQRLVKNTRTEFAKRNGENVSKIVDNIKEAASPEAKVDKMVAKQQDKIARQLSDTPTWAGATPVRKNEILELIRAHLKDRQEAFVDKMDTFGVSRPLTESIDRMATENRRRIEAIAQTKEMRDRAKRIDAAADQIAKQLSDTPTFAQRGQPDLAKALIKAHLKEPQADFVKRLVELGADENTAYTIDRLSIENRDRIQKIDRAKRAEELRKQNTPGNKVAKKLGKSEWEKIVELADHGLLTEKTFMDAAAERLGLPHLTQDAQAHILELAGKVRDATRGTPQDLAKQDLARFIKSKMGYKIADIPTGVYYSNMLSGYNTHLVNLVDTAFNVFAEINNMALANPRAAARVWGGGLRGFGEGLNDFWVALSAGRQLTNSKWLEVPDIMEVARFGERGGVPPISPGTRTGRAMHWLAESKIAYPLRGAKYVGRLMSASDALMYRTAHEARASLIADRVAREEGLKGRELDKRVQELLGRSTDQEAAAWDQATSEGFTGAQRRVRAMELRSQVRGMDANADATEFAGWTTYNHQPRGWLGHFSNAVDRAFAPLPLARAVIIPFTKIVANVTNRKLDYFPVVGHMRAIRGYYGDEATPQGDERAALMMRANMGTMALAGLGAAQYAGLLNIHGSGPSDTKKRKQLIETGWKPYTLEIGGRYYSYMTTPPGLMISTLGNVIDTYRYDELNKKDPVIRSAYVVSQIPVTVFNQSFLNSLSTLFDAMSQTDPERSIFAMKKFASSTIGSATTPRIALDVQRIFDPKMYQGDTIQGVLLQNTPFASLVNRPVLNAFGEPVKPPSNRFISTVTKDMAWQTVIKAQLLVPLPAKDTKMPDGHGKDRDITPAEYYELVRQSGPKIRDWVVKNTPVLLRLKDKGEMYQKPIQEELSKFSEDTRAVILAKQRAYALHHPVD